MKQDKDGMIYFSAEQYRLLARTFPQVVFGPQATEHELRHYMGQRSVLEFVKRRTVGLNNDDGEF